MPIAIGLATGLLGLGGGGGSGNSQVPSLGVNSGNQAVDQLGGQVLGNLASNIMGQLTGAFANTLGAVFGNGMDLSCWGSSFTPAQAKIEAPKFFQACLNDSGVLQNPTTDTLDKFSRILWCRIRDYQIGSGMSQYASCTRKGWLLEVDYHQTNFDLVLNGLRSAGYILTERNGGNATLSGCGGKGAGTYPSFTVSTPVNGIPVEPLTNPVDGNTVTPIYGGTGYVNGVPVRPPKKDSGFNPLWLLALLGLI